MAAKRPKILSALTVPSGGWDLDFTISDGVSPQALTATVPAGTYFVAWDGQSDDLLYQVAFQMRTAIVNAGLGANRSVSVGINDAKKVVVQFVGSAFTGTPDDEVELNWSTSDADLRKALGASGTDQTSTGTTRPTITLPYQHGYGWYSTEDGQLEELTTEDVPVSVISQGLALDGSASTVHWATRYEAAIKLGFLTRAQTWTRGAAYGDTPLYREYPRNVGLESWWYAVRDGTRFRVYETDAPFTRDTDGVELGVTTLASTTVIEDTSKSWETDPQEWKGMLVVIDRAASLSGWSNRAYVSSHTADTITTPAAMPGGTFWSGVGDPFTVYDARYQTYVIDAEAISEFRPQEVPKLDRYGITIPMKRYVA